MIEKIKYWCHKVLPLVYDDSLSYYETLCKVTDKVNECVDAVNDLDETVEDFEEEIDAKQDQLTAGNGITLNGANISVNQAQLTTKQNTLVSGTNIKTINNQTVLGSGNLTINTQTYVAGNGIDITSGAISVDQTELTTKQDTLVSGTNIKTINGNSILGPGNLVINPGLALYKHSFTITNLILGSVTGSVITNEGMPFNSINNLMNFVWNGTGKLCIDLRLYNCPVLMVTATEGLTPDWTLYYYNTTLSQIVNETLSNTDSFEDTVTTIS